MKIMAAKRSEGERFEFMLECLQKQLDIDEKKYTNPLVLQVARLCRCPARTL
jgi:hypothetical protein